MEEPRPRHGRDRAVRRLLEAGPRIDSSPWALSIEALDLVLAEIAAGRERIVECGSGMSTILIARLLAERGSGTLHSLEHEPRWASETRERLRAEGLDPRATVIEAPLGWHPLAEPGCRWYGGDALAKLPDGGVDILIVDGPPAGEPPFERSRYPALPVIGARMVPGGTVILDDIGRPGERWVAERWREELGIVLEERAGGAAIGTLDEPPAGVSPPRPGHRSTTLRSRLRGMIDGGLSAPAAAVDARLRRRTGIVGLERQVAELERQLSAAWNHVATVERNVVNHEQRIRRLAELDAFRAWIEDATLTQTPLISVITPARMRPDPLSRAIESVLAQEYDRWEQIVIVDGGDEASVAAAEAAGDDRVRCLSIPHSGVATARNTGLEAARGELIAYLDDDNRMHRLWLKSLAWAIAQRPDVEVLYGGWIIDDPERLYGQVGGGMPEYWITPFDRQLQARQALADMSAIAHRPGLPEAVFDPELPSFHDWDLLQRLTADREPLVLPAVAAYYTTDGDSRMTAGLTEEQARGPVLAKARRRADAADRRARLVEP
jgi:predicted O-methyltransferase YrrM